MGFGALGDKSEKNYYWDIWFKRLGLQVQILSFLRRILPNIRFRRSTMSKTYPQNQKTRRICCEFWWTWDTVRKTIFGIIVEQEKINCFALLFVRCLTNFITRYRTIKIFRTPELTTFPFHFIFLAPKHDKVLYINRCITTNE